MMYKPGIPSAPGPAELHYPLLCPVGFYNFSIREEECFHLEQEVVIVYFHVYRGNIQTCWDHRYAWLSPQCPLTGMLSREADLKQ